MMRTRLKDVAAKLNLSPALVSGVLNDRPHIWASEETRERILEAARTLNYRPSAAAQALSKGKTNSISLVYRRLQGAAYRFAYSGLVDALSEELQYAGYDLVVSNFASQEEVLSHLQKLASSRGCDAVVLWGREVDTEPQAELLESLNMPFLVKGRHEVLHPNWHQIDFDHEGMMEQAVERLFSLGHRRIAYLGFPHDEGYVHSLRRGFSNAHLRLLGVSPAPVMLGEAEDDVARNAEHIARWLSLPTSDRPTAFAIGAGNKAWQALEAGLAQIGERLRDSADGYSACGITSTPFSLIFGEAYAYQGIEIDNLARDVTPGLLRSLEGGAPDGFIARFRPELTPASSLDVLSHGVTFITQKETPTS